MGRGPQLAAVCITLVTHTHLPPAVFLLSGQLADIIMFTILLSNHQHCSFLLYTFETCTVAQISPKQMRSPLHFVPVWEGRGLHKVLRGLLGNVAVGFCRRQSCRCPSYLFITEIINVYKRLLIALFTNDLWDL